MTTKKDNHDDECADIKTEIPEGRGRARRVQHRAVQRAGFRDGAFKPAYASADRLWRNCALQQPSQDNGFATGWPYRLLCAENSRREGDAVEFKASGVSAAKNTKIIEFLESKGEEQTEADRTNIERLKELNPISQAWILAKSIAGMANNAGGKIFVGINNSGKIVGLGRDFAAEGLDKLKGMERWDKYAIRLRERIECMFKNRAVAGVLFRLTPEKSGKKDYFVISIQESSTPIFICKEPETKTWKKTLSPDEFKEFYLRLGGATKHVPYKKAEEYIKTRFPGYSE